MKSRKRAASERTQAVERGSAGREASERGVRVERVEGAERVTDTTRAGGPSAASERSEQAAL